MGHWARAPCSLHMYTPILSIAIYLSLVGSGNTTHFPHAVVYLALHFSRLLWAICTEMYVILA